MAQGNDVEVESRKLKKNWKWMSWKYWMNPFLLSAASIHGVISSLSPIKKGCKSNCTISDGKSKVRLVGFNPLQRTRMKILMDKKQAVKLEDCEVRHARRGQNMEILLKGSTKIGIYISKEVRLYKYSNR